MPVFGRSPAPLNACRTGRAFPFNLFVLKKEAQKGFTVQSLTQNLFTLQKTVLHIIIPL